MKREGPQAEGVRHGCTWAGQGGQGYAGGGHRSPQHAEGAAQRGMSHARERRSDGRQYPGENCGKSVVWSDL